MHDVAAALQQIQQRVEAAATAAGRDPSSVCLIAVSKRQPDERLWAAYEAGQRDFGENYVQELERKQALLPDDARFHLIGHVQSNKAKRASAAHLVHTVDSAKLARALAKGGGARALIQVRQGDEDSKSGLEPDAVEALLEDRALARASKDFARADALRDGFVAAGVVVKDTAHGAEWELGADFDIAKLKGLTQ